MGGSILINGTPLHGVRNLSGEFGHICVETGGRACTCGQHGCLEAYCSTAALAEEQGCTLEDFFNRAAERDRRALEALDSYLGHLARGIHAIRMVLDCPVVIGGITSYYLQPYIGRLDALVRDLDPFASAGQQPVMTSLHPFHGVAFGAACRWSSASSPRYRKPRTSSPPPPALGQSPRSVPSISRLRMSPMTT